MAKAFALTRQIRTTFDRAQHGLSEQLLPGGTEVVDAYLNAFASPSPRGVPNLFADLLAALGGGSVAARYDVANLLPQIVAGHRLWCDATAKRERFIAIERIDIMEQESLNRLWIRLNIFADDLSRLGVTHKQLLSESMIGSRWREVDSGTLGGRKLLRFEQTRTTSYTHRPSDEIPRLVAGFRTHLWATVNTSPPYRRHYLYLAPAAEQGQVLAQLPSIYATMYYLSSVARYRPGQFNRILEGAYGEQIQEILVSQPNQFLYLLASEFVQRDVTRAAII